MSKNEEIEEIEELEETTEETVEEISVEETLKKELSEMEDKFLRAQAEIVNMRNRHNKEREDSAKYRAQNLAKDLLTALDNLDRALEIETNDEHGESMKKGIEMVREGMLHAFKEAGVEEIDSLGQTFDPNKHQAVQTIPLSEGQESDEIVQVLQKGYILHDRILRPAMVIVAQ
ncbi:nucleotide exchange factor GrpE [Vagococcus carniphilus]|uniref:nucleotide exchange factor GrpE n=1 Tax=Vagococcus carniphilus TaxID=218144 RepID=UPI00288F4F34|nr:nucleotide exchange factor GrpE [Vagococcus carniphilus]MDT2815457.1 nucleotide exchange factor GrpE [Vagococcus carniphilus]MDT2864565.1 nucleotide exchange factor GrpE [Vagococcus carniphilus]